MGVKFSSFLFLVVFSAAVSGCNRQGADGALVEGDVTVNGQPLSCATISWLPEKGTPGGKCTALIDQGRFEITADRNLRPGHYRVRVAMLPPETIQIAKKKNPDYAIFEGKVIASSSDANSDFSREVIANEVNRFEIKVEFGRNKSAN